MRILLDKKSARAVDDYAVKSLGFTPLLLMENVARDCRDYLRMYLLGKKKAAIFCGTGNNGGDGLAIARQLIVSGLKNLKIYIYGDINRLTSEGALNYKILKSLDANMVVFKSADELKNYRLHFDCLIEALIGIGGDDNLRVGLAEVLKILNDIKCCKIAIDVPAGLNIDTGMAHEHAFKANYTFSVFSYKKGFFINRGPELCGEVSIAQMGIQDNIQSDFADRYKLDLTDLDAVIGTRNRTASKYNHGRILIIAGSAKYSGAAALTANAAVQSGGGMVYLASVSYHETLYPEVIRIPLKPTPDGSIAYDNLSLLEQDLHKYDVIVVGPGLTDNAETIQLVKDVVNLSGNKKIIIDADGLKAIDYQKPLGQNVVITPHIYEFSRLTGMSINEINDNPEKAAIEAAVKLNCIIHLKCVPAITTDGKTHFWTLEGNPGMATAGSGDVLSGIMAVMVFRRDNTLLGAASAAYVHGRSGNLYARRHSQETLRASDLINYLKYVLR